jgi:hypothetical protein
MAFFTMLDARYASQLIGSLAPFSIGIHCMVHKCNLAFKTLSCLEIVSSIKIFYKLDFAYNLNQHLKLIKFIDMIETKGLKMFKNVKTQWISLLEL